MADQAVVVFRLGAEEFAAPVHQVREVLPLEGTTRVPRAQDGVEGVVNIRGQIVPVVNLTRRLGLGDGVPPPGSRIMVASPPHGGPVGFVVDEVIEVLRLAPGSIEPPPALVLSERSKDFIQGVAKVGDRLVLVCDLAALLATRGAA